MSDDRKTLPEKKPSWYIRLMHPKFAIPIATLLFLLLAPFVYRGYRLATVPDIGEPFDVAEFIEENQVADVDNAAITFEEACQLLNRGPIDINLEDALEAFECGREIDLRGEKSFKWAKANRAALQKFIEASHQSNYRAMPLEELDLQDMIEVSLSREMFWLCLISGWYEFHEGNEKAAFDYFLAGMKMGPHIAKNGGPVDSRIGLAFYSMSMSSMLPFLTRTSLSTATMEQMKTEIIDVNKSIVPLTDMLKMSYLAHQNSLAQEDELDEWASYNSEIQETIGESGLPFAIWLMGEPDLTARLNRITVKNALTQASSPLYARSPARRIEKSMLYQEAADPTKLIDLPYSADEVKQFMESCLLNELFDVEAADLIATHDRNRQQRHLLEIAVQLEIHRRMNGDYPEKLQDLDVSSLNTNVDFYAENGEPLKYQLIAPNHCQIWSVYQNGTDDGGCENLTVNLNEAEQASTARQFWGRETGDDIGVEMKIIAP